MFGNFSAYLIGLGGEILGISFVGVLLALFVSLSSSSCVETLGEGEEAGVGVLVALLYENGTDLDLGMVFDLRDVNEATIECPCRFLKLYYSLFGEHLNSSNSWS